MQQNSEKKTCRFTRPLVKPACLPQHRCSPLLQLKSSLATDERNNYNTLHVYFIGRGLTYKFTFSFEIFFQIARSLQAPRKQKLSTYKKGMKKLRLLQESKIPKLETKLNASVLANATESSTRRIQTTPSISFIFVRRHSFGVSMSVSSGILTLLGSDDPG